MTCSYREQEFFRCGYYVNNFYENEEWNITPPEQVQLDKLKRHILFDKPRITKFNISWDQQKSHVDQSYNNFMFDENYHNNKIQNEFKNIDYNSYNQNNNANSFQNALMLNNVKKNQDLNDEESRKVFEDLIKGKKQN